MVDILLRDLKHELIHLAALDVLDAGECSVDGGHFTDSNSGVFVPCHTSGPHFLHRRRGGRFRRLMRAPHFGQAAMFIHPPATSGDGLRPLTSRPSPAAADSRANFFASE
jgi:hypothetical protein